MDFQFFSGHPVVARVRESCTSQSVQFSIIRRVYVYLVCI